MRLKNGKWIDNAKDQTKSILQLVMLEGLKSELYVFAIQLNLRLGAKHNLFLSQPSTLFLFHSFFSYKELGLLMLVVIMGMLIFRWILKYFFDL